MAEIKVGDRVRIKDRPGWVSPPGYRLAGSEGTVTRIWEPQGREAFHDYVVVSIEKTEVNLDIETALTFRAENLEKI